MTLPFNYQIVSSGPYNASTAWLGRTPSTSLFARLNGVGRFVACLWNGAFGTGTGYPMLTAGVVDTMLTQGTTIALGNSTFSSSQTAISALPGSADLIVAITPNVLSSPNPLQAQIWSVDGSYNLTNEATLLSAFTPSLNCRVSVVGVSDEMFVVARTQNNSGGANVVLNIGEWNGTLLSIGPELEVFGGATDIGEIHLVHQSQYEVVTYFFNETAGKVQAVHLNLLGVPALGNVQDIASGLLSTRLSATKLDNLWSIMAYKTADDELIASVIRVTSSTATFSVPVQINPAAMIVGGVGLSAMHGSKILASYEDTINRVIYVREINRTGFTILSMGDITEVNEIMSSDDRSQAAVQALGGDAALVTYGQHFTFDWWFAYVPVNQGIKVLGTAVSGGAGIYIYTTTWNDGLITLRVTESIDPSVTVAEFSLGAASLAEVDNKTWWAYPLAVDGDDLEVIIYGRMNNPAGLGTSHIIWSTDAGFSFALMEGGWGDDHCGAMVNGGINVYALRNTVSSLGGPTTQAKLYSSLPGGSPSLISTLPFAQGVNPRAMEYDFNGNIIAAADGAEATMVVYAVSPYTTWVDITGNHQTADGVKSLEVIS